MDYSGSMVHRGALRDIRKILFVGGDVVAAAIGRWTVDTTSMYMWDEGRITVRVALVF